MRKLIATATAGLAITAGSIGLAVAGPLSGAFAQPTPTTAPATAPADGATNARHPRLRAFVKHEGKAAAAIIGIEPRELLQAYRDGQSIAEVAQAHGIDPQQLVDHLVADASTKLDEAVANGTITQERADAAKAKLPERATKLVNRHKGDAKG